MSCLPTSEYPNQVFAPACDVSWLDPNKVRKVTLVGSRKMVVYDDVAEDKLVIYDKGIDSPMPPGADLPFDQSAAGMKLVYRSGDSHVPKLPAVEPLHEEARDFLGAITEKRLPRSGASSGRDVVATLQAASLSLKENSRRVSLDGIFSASAP